MSRQSRSFLASASRLADLSRPSPPRRPDERGGLTDCPAVGDRDRPTRRPAHRRDRRCRRARLPRRLAGRRARPGCLSQAPPPAGRRGSREPEPVDNALGRAAAGLAVGLAATPWPRRRLARPAAPQPPPPSPERSPATARGTGTDVRGDRPGRSPQVALERHHAAPSCGRWQPHRPPPAGAGSVVNRCGGGWSAPWQTRRPTRPGQHPGDRSRGGHPPSLRHRPQPRRAPRRHGPGATVRLDPCPAGVDKSGA